MSEFVDQLVAGSTHVLDDMSPGTTVELVVIEQHKQRLRSLDVRPPATYAVAECTADQTGRANLAVPAGLPPAYDGVMLAFGYELDVSAAASASTSWTVDVTGGPLPTTSRPASSPPLTYSKRVRQPGVREKRAEQVQIGLIALGAAATLLVVGLLGVDRSDTGGLAIVGFGVALLSAAGIAAMSVLWSRGRHLDGVELVMTPPTIAAAVSSRSISHLHPPNRWI